jgi:pimeloyl-ACP methyl ester carboxylesterase
MMNQNLVLFDYSGYGLSDGEPRTRRILKDGEKVLEWTLKRVDEKNLIIWGESLGGSIASYLASKNKCSKLVLFATFASLNDLAFNGEMSYFMKAIQMVLNIFVHPLPTKDWLKNSKAPVLVVHSEDDELISIDHARKLKNIDPKRVKLLEIKGGHGTPKLFEKDLSEILSFCDVRSEVDHRACLTIFDNVSKEIWTE